MNSMFHQPVAMHPGIRFQQALRAVAGAALLSMQGLAMASPVVTFTAVDEVDAVPGTDHWRYDYAISGTASSFDSVNLLFAPDRYGALEVLSADALLSTLAIDPSPLLPADGQVTATFLAPLASPQELLLSVRFAWTGAGTPGAQPFEVLDSGFSVVGAGTTAPPGATAVPEPPMSLLLLTLMGAAALFGNRGLRRLRTSTQSVLIDGLG